MEAMFRIRMRANGLELNVVREEGVPRYVVSDEGKPRQILINLLGNAGKFTRGGGVSLSTAATREASDGPRLVIEVEDAGTGIAADELEDIFKPFKQTAGASEENEGTGLGLAISRTHARRKAGGWPGDGRGCHREKPFGRGQCIPFGDRC